MNIKDIAKIAGVSTATVSRVMNNSGYVKEETRLRILEVIEQTNYIPNAIARSLCMQDRFSIGVMVPDIANEFFSEMFRGITEITEKSAYNILFFNTDERAEVEHSYLKVVESERLRGLIIAPVSAGDSETGSELQRLEKAGIPVVLVDRDMNGIELDGVFVDNCQGAYDGVSALIREGHRKIAIITGPVTSYPGRERLRGYRKALEDAGIPLRPEYEVSGNFKTDKAYEQTARLLSLEDRPTAIFTANNLTSLGCLKYLTERQLMLGRDVAVMGFDGLTSLNIIDFPLSAVERDARLQGREAIRLLLEKLEAEKRGDPPGIRKKICVPHQVVLRGSEKYAG